MFSSSSYIFFGTTHTRCKYMGFGRLETKFISIKFDYLKRRSRTPSTIEPPSVTIISQCSSTRILPYFQIVTSPVNSIAGRSFLFLFLPLLYKGLPPIYLLWLLDSMILFYYNITLPGSYSQVFVSSFTQVTTPIPTLYFFSSLHLSFSYPLF